MTGVQGGGAGAGDAAGNGRDSSASLRETELPMRDRRAAALPGGPHLLAGQPGQVGDAPGGDDRVGAGGHSPLPAGPPGLGSGGQRGSRGTGRPLGPAALSEAFGSSEKLFVGLVEFLRDGQVAALTQEELETRLDLDGRALVCQGSSQPAPSGRGAQPARRTLFAWSERAGRHRGHPRQLRGGAGRYRAGDGRRVGQAAGGTTGPPGGGRRR